MKQASSMPALPKMTSVQTPDMQFEAAASARALAPKTPLTSKTATKADLSKLLSESIEKSLPVLHQTTCVEGGDLASNISEAKFLSFQEKAFCAKVERGNS
jgi:hypothetical protein